MIYNTLRSFNFFLTFVILYSISLPLSAQVDSFKLDSIKAYKVYSSGYRLYFKGEYQIALDSFYLSLQLKQELFGTNDIRLTTNYNAIGIAYKSLGKLNEGIDALQTSIEIIKSTHGERDVRLGTPYTNLGNIYRQKGNFADALRYHQQALINYSQNPARYFDQIQQVTYNVCENLFFTNQHSEALELLFKNLNNGNADLRWKYFNIAGNIYRDLNNFDLAQDYFLKSIEVLTALKGKDYYEAGYSYINFAQFLVLREEFDLAEEYINKAKPIIQEIFGEKGIDPAELYATLGDLFTSKTFDSSSLQNFRTKKKENLLAALSQYQKALIALTENFDDANINTNPDVEHCTFEAQCLRILQKKTETFYKLAEISLDNKEQRLDYLSNSLNATIIASDLLNTVRTEIVNEESKILLSEIQNTTFLNTIAISYDLLKLTGDKKYLDIAFINAERNKAASLMDNLTDQNAREVSLIPDSILVKEENINLQISFINDELFNEVQYGENKPEKVENFKAQLFLLEQEKADLTRFMETNYEEYYQMKYANNKISTNEIQEKLHKDEIILEYVFDINESKNRSNLYVFLLSVDNLELLKFNVAQQDLSDIQILHDFLSDPNYISITNEKFSNYLSSSYNLYRLLIKPVEDKISERTITVIPDGILSYIPFDALLYENIKDTRINFRNLPYLIKRHTFNYAYSSNLYVNSFKKATSSKKLLAFAPSYKSNIVTNDEDFKKLSPLSGVKEEVNSIASHIKTDAFIDSSATEGNFMKNYENYDILHLSMHTLLNDSLPMFSKLAFMPSSGSSPENDGWLTTQEIYNLNLNSRLAVLSACNTGSGTLRKGEGVISLARGFIYAGCPSIIMTLWEVEDRSGASILEEFYHLLSNGKKKHQALRQAKLKHIENADPLKAHPHYWLGYVSIGNSDAMYTSNDVYFFLAILVIIIAVLLDQIFRNKKARKNPGLRNYN